MDPKRVPSKEELLNWLQTIPDVSYEMTDDAGVKLKRTYSVE